MFPGPYDFFTEYVYYMNNITVHLCYAIYKTKPLSLL